MQFYQENYVTYSRSEAERVSAIPMPANKRNYQKQADHLEEARAIRDIRMKRQDRDWREGNGRPKGSGEKSKIVEDCRRMAASAPGRKESRLHTGDRIEQAHSLQVVEVGHT